LQHNCEAKETGQLRHQIATAGSLCVKDRATSNGEETAAKVATDGNSLVTNGARATGARQLIRSVDAGAAILPSSCRLHAIPYAGGHSVRRYHYRV